MDIDEARDKIIGKIRLNLPGYEQLLPRGQLALQWEIKQILKEYRKDIPNTNDKHKCSLR